MSKKRANPIPAEMPQPATGPSDFDPLRDLLTKLLQGKQPENQGQSRLLVKWTHLAKSEKQALAAKWNLPGMQVAHDKLAKQALAKLKEARAV